MTKTMHETYGEPNDEAGKHECCEKCGNCIPCEDCKCEEKNDIYYDKNKETLKGETTQ